MHRADDHDAGHSACIVRQSWKAGMSMCIEMDAASHNGVDDVRQINEAARYAPVSARYKVYILDEVHMLSTPAFNALLKTLEEPPPHVKFIFATTEIRKVPITILSRCQRFDLRRVDADAAGRRISKASARKEGVEVEPEALALIARAAEGSVRDSLSLLDQAIAHAAGRVRAEDVRQMLGLADRARVIDLFEALMRGDISAALTELRDQYDIGADPAVVLSRSRRVHAFRHAREDGAGDLPTTPRWPRPSARRGRACADSCRCACSRAPGRCCSRVIAEVQARGRAARRRRDGAGAHRLCGRSADARTKSFACHRKRRHDAGAEAVAARLTAADTWCPAMRRSCATMRRALAPADRVAAHGRPTRRPARSAGCSRAGRTARAHHTFAELIALGRRKARPADQDCAGARRAPGALSRTASSRSRWSRAPPRCCSATTFGDKISAMDRPPLDGRGVRPSRGAPTVACADRGARRELKRGVRADPLVQAVLERFPGAEIVGVRARDGGLEAARRYSDEPPRL